MALTQDERTALMAKLAQKHRIDITQLQAYNLVQLRELWRVLDSAASAEQWVKAARRGFGAVVESQQNNAAVIAAGLFMNAGEIYKESGQASKKFRPSTGDAKAFMADKAKPVAGYAARSANYYLSAVERGELGREQAMKQLEGVAQEAMMNTSREYITQASLVDDAVEATEEAAPLEERYAPKTEERLVDEDHYSFEDDEMEADGLWSEDEEDETLDSWLDEEFEDEDDDDWDYFGEDEEEVPIDELLDDEMIKQWKEEQTAKPAPTWSDVKVTGCDYCKIVGLNKGPHKWHKHCTCILLPKWNGFSTNRPPWEEETEALYYKARAVAERNVNKRGDNVTMDDIMREIRVMQAIEKNKERIANGEKPRKPHPRKPAKTAAQKRAIRERNAARLERARARGEW